MHQQYGGHSGGADSPEEKGPADADVELELKGWSHVTKNGGSVDWKYYCPRRCVSAETIRNGSVNISMAKHEQGHFRIVVVCVAMTSSIQGILCVDV